MIEIDLGDVQWSAIRAQGAGGQNINKVSTALQLRFDIAASSLPEAVKDRLMHCADQRISDAGVIIIKAQRFRSQERNRQDALARLQAMIDNVAAPPAQRRPTRPTRSSQRRRVETKLRHGQTKAARRKANEA